MKKTIITLATLFAVVASFSQQVAKAKEQEVSNAEKFSERSGTLVQKEFIDIGTLKKCEIQVAIFTDLISGQKSSAVRFEYESKSSYSSDTKVAILDEDEIDGLIKSIKIIQSKVLPSKASNYTEVNFRSRSGFSAGCFSKKDTWTTFMKLEKYDSNSYVFMEAEDLAELLKILEASKLKL
jgi:hypothetical protein